VDDGVWFTLVQISHAPGHPEGVAMNKKTISTKQCGFQHGNLSFFVRKTNYLAISRAYLSTF
jgi:hypothetical protein